MPAFDATPSFEQQNTQSTYGSAGVVEHLFDRETWNDKASLLREISETPLPTNDEGRTMKLAFDATPSFEQQNTQSTHGSDGVVEHLFDRETWNDKSSLLREISETPLSTNDQGRMMKLGACKGHGSSSGTSVPPPPPPPPAVWTFTPCVAVFLIHTMSSILFDSCKLCPII